MSYIAGSVNHIPVNIHLTPESHARAVLCASRIKGNSADAVALGLQLLELALTHQAGGARVVIEYVDAEDCANQRLVLNTLVAP